MAGALRIAVLCQSLARDRALLVRICLDWARIDRKASRPTRMTGRRTLLRCFVLVRANPTQQCVHEGYSLIGNESTIKRCYEQYTKRPRTPDARISVL